MAESQQSHKVSGEYRYDDMVMIGSCPPNILDRIKDVELGQDILVASYPKTGSTWLQHILWLVENHQDLEDVSTEPLDERVLFMEMQVSHTSSLDLLSGRPHPRLIKTHLPAKFFEKQITNDDVRIIVPMRNPKDTLVSYYHFYRMCVVFGKFVGTWDEFFDLYSQKALAFGDIFDWYEGWWAHHDSNKIIYVKYEDMVKNLPEVIRQMGVFLGKTLNDETINKINSLCTFQAMTENDATNYTWRSKAIMDMDISPFMRKGTVGDWRNYFSPQQNKALEENIQRIKQLGLHFEF